MMTVGNLYYTPRSYVFLVTMLYLIIPSRRASGGARNSVRPQVWSEDFSYQGVNKCKSCMMTAGPEMGKSRTSILPTIMDNPDTVIHSEGEMAILYCSVLNLGDSMVTWRKLPKTSPLTIGTKSWVRDLRVHAEHVPYSSQWNLVIEQVRIDDAGEYECQVNKRKSQLRHKVTLVVKAKPAALLPRIEISGQNVLKVGSLLQLTCNVILVDVSMETVTWTKDGVSLLQIRDDRYSVQTSTTISGQNSGVVRSRLEIKDARSNDSGVYICRSSERAQMAGVKVQIQGSHNLKRVYMPDWSAGTRANSASLTNVSSPPTESTYRLM